MVSESFESICEFFLTVYNYLWPKTDTFLPEMVSVIFESICEFFWTACNDGQKRTLFCPKWSQGVSKQICDFFLNNMYLWQERWPKTDTFLPEMVLVIFESICEFFERHVMMAKNGHFFVQNGLTFFLNMMSSWEFLCVFFYTSPCYARKAGLRPALLAPRLELHCFH